MDINENNRRVNEIAIEMGASGVGPCPGCGFEMYSGFGHMCGGVSRPIPSMDSFDPSTVTLRDQFAMAALTGMLSSQMDIDGDTMAMGSYCYADAMMEARNVKPSTDKAGAIDGR